LGRGRGLRELLAHLERIGETAEGINSIRSGRELAARQRLHMPLAECVYAVAYERAEPRRAFERLWSDSTVSASLAAQ
jgi:glycerol-3-phosphate dehydrogenase